MRKIFQRDFIYVLPRLKRGATLYLVTKEGRLVIASILDFANDKLRVKILGTKTVVSYDVEKLFTVSFNQEDVHADKNYRNERMVKKMSRNLTGAFWLILAALITVALITITAINAYAFDCDPQVEYCQTHITSTPHWRSAETNYGNWRQTLEPQAPYQIRQVVRGEDVDCGGWGNRACSSWGEFLSDRYNWGD